MSYVDRYMRYNAIESAALRGHESAVKLLASFSCPVSHSLKYHVMTSGELERSARRVNTAVIKSLLFVLAVNSASKDLV